MSNPRKCQCSTCNHFEGVECNPVYSGRLENRTDGHHKYWEYVWDMKSQTVTTFWGRMPYGRTPSVVSAHSLYVKARAHINRSRTDRTRPMSHQGLNDLIRHKMGKGYVYTSGPFIPEIDDDLLDKGEAVAPQPQVQTPAKAGRWKPGLAPVQRTQLKRVTHT